MSADNSANTGENENDDEARPQVNVLLALGYPALMKGLNFTITTETNMRVCGEAGDVRKALDLCTRLQPHVVLLDTMLDEGRGKELIQELPLRRKNLGVVVMSADEQPTSVQGALKAGALGYLSLRDSMADIVRAIERACTGLRTVSTLVSDILADQMAANGVDRDVEAKKKLSAREWDVYRLMGAGKKTKEIATELGVGVKTVESHEHNIKRKLNLKTNGDIRVRAAATNGKRNGTTDS